MKKKNIVLAVSIVTLSVCLYLSKMEKTKQSVVELANIEALAMGETSDNTGCKLHLTSICTTIHSDHYLYRNR